VAAGISDGGGVGDGIGGTWPRAGIWLAASIRRAARTARADRRIRTQVVATKALLAQRNVRDPACGPHNSSDRIDQEDWTT
jgi:hypothetical protein